VTSRRHIALALFQLADLGVVLAALVVAVAATTGSAGVDHWAQILEVRISLRNLLFVGAYLAAFHLLFRNLGLYRSHRLSATSHELRDLATAVALGTLPLLPLGTLLHFEYVAPLFLIAFFSLAFLGLATERILVRAAVRWLRRHGQNLRDVVIVGDSGPALDAGAALMQRDELGYRVVDIVQVGGADERNDAVVPRVAALLEQPIDEVFLAVPLGRCPSLIAQLIALCEEQGVTVRLVASIAELDWARVAVDALAGQPVLTISSLPPNSVHLMVKRAIDVAGAALGLLLLSPLFALIAVAVKLDSPGPAIYVQERVGLNRRRLRTYKFRTMVEGADRQQAALEARNEAQGAVFKIAEDPRVTRLGRWLRRSSLDELPQLLNVLVGDMSLVGPRPLPVRDVDRIEVRWHKRRFSVKPGITCLWQVTRREPIFDQWVRSDMEYIDNWSLGLDLRILARTVPAVLSGRGAQ
jgi:exopolysaccharide biosynthesis polyprenyl glycosylphosphotransferase